MWTCERCGQGKVPEAPNHMDDPSTTSCLRALGAAVVTLRPTLRDQFAMAALAASGRVAGTPETLAVVAYELADAMLAAREVKP